ncbi:MAG TPA: hypothetical protein VJN68_06835, partial [Burkholderiaceae bacterium]|nr:hypothetical protein [Burkholderiaceae bacterium]
AEFEQEFGQARNQTRDTRWCHAAKTSDIPGKPLSGAARSPMVQCPKTTLNSKTRWHGRMQFTYIHKSVYGSSAFGRIGRDG